MTDFTLAQMRELVKRLNTRDEIKAAFDILRARDSELQSIKAIEFRIGDSVSFMARPKYEKREKLFRGIVTKINLKSIKVKIENGGEWRVSPTLLKKLPIVTPV